jgi:hypothetical protein
VDAQIRCREIIARRQHRLTSKSRQRIHGAISEIELRPVSHSFSKSSKRCNGQPRLDFIKWNHLAHQLVYQLVQPESGVKILPVQQRYRCAGPLSGVGMPVNTALGDQLSLEVMLS